jgi:Cell wall synthesis protein CwsA
MSTERQAAERRQMSAKAETRLTPRERLTRGLTYSAVGPVDVTRGVVGLGVHSAQSTASELRRRYREGQLARELAAAQESLAQELAAAQEVVANLPQALQEARKKQRHGKRPWVIAGAAVALLATGAISFSIIRRSKNRPEPSPRPPSVDVQPRP